ncbi:hypothetical protein [Pedobacter panaciterrae]
MKMTLEFNLPEEQQEADEALNVGKLSSAIFSFNQKLRSVIKHSNNEEEIKHAEWAQELLFQELDGLNYIFEL